MCYLTIIIGKQGQLGTGGTSDQHFPISLDIETHALSVECGGDERHPFTLGNTYTHTVWGR